MQFYILILLLCFVIFLFCLHFLARDDFIFLRKNITMEKIFNLAFLLAFVGLFSSRLAFVLLDFHTIYFNPLVFFIFPYFPGLSLAGGMLGSVGFLLYFASLQKLPFQKLFDFFSLSFLSAVSTGSLGLFLLSGNHVLPPCFLWSLYYIFCSLSFLSFIFYPELFRED